MDVIWQPARVRTTGELTQVHAVPQLCSGSDSADTTSGLCNAGEVPGHLLAAQTQPFLPGLNAPQDTFTPSTTFDPMATVEAKGQLGEVCQCNTSGQPGPAAVQGPSRGQDWLFHSVPLILCTGQGLYLERLQQIGWGSVPSIYCRSCPSQLFLSSPASWDT